MKKKEIWIVVILAAVLVAVIAVYRITVSSNAKTNTATVEILHDNQVVQSFDPNVDAVYHIQGSYGMLDVEVKDGKWHVTNEDCPNHICSKTGWVSVDDYKPIVCLPNEVVVQLSES